jgi:hypothetical protein
LLRVSGWRKKTLGAALVFVESKKAFLALASYWILFIIAPTVAALFLLGISAKNGAACLGIFLILVLVGEHGLRRWKRLFGDD